MFWIILVAALLFVGWITYEFHRAPLMEDENNIFDDDDDDPTTTCWDDDDNKNHTEGHFN